MTRRPWAHGRCGSAPWLPMQTRASWSCRRRVEWREASGQNRGVKTAGAYSLRSRVLEWSTNSAREVRTQSVSSASRPDRHWPVRPILLPPCRSYGDSGSVQPQKRDPQCQTCLVKTGALPRAFAEPSIASAPHSREAQRRRLAAKEGNGADVRGT